MRQIAELKLALHKAGIEHKIAQHGEREYVLSLRHVLDQPILYSICRDLDIQVERSGTSTYVITLLGA